MAHHDTLTQDVKTKAHDLGADAADAAKAKVTETAETAKARTVEEVEQVANAADAAAQEFPDGSLQAQLADQVAQQAERFARNVSDIDVNALTRDAADFARRNPLVFVGGAALVGLLAARFLKARDPQPTMVSYPNDDPWSARAGSPVAGGHDVTS